VIFSP